MKTTKNILIGLLLTLPVTGWGWSAAIDSPEMGFPQNVFQEDMEAVVSFLRDEVEFLEGRFINEYTNQSYAATAAALNELVPLLTEKGRLDVTVRFAAMDQERVAFALFQDRHRERVTISINTASPTLDFSELVIRVPARIDVLKSEEDPGDDQAMLSRDEVIRLASEKAEIEGIDLERYQAPEARPLLSGPWDPERFMWSVVFRGREPVFGNHFMITVDDRTKETRLILGR